MTPPDTDGARPSALARSAPLIGGAVVLVIIAVAIAVASRNGTDGPVDKGSTASGEAPVTFEQAKRQGREKTIRWVDNCDTETGRIRVPSVYAALCVPAFEGDNGGETGRGVTGDTITVVAYVARQDSDFMAQLGGNFDPPEVAAETGQKYAAMLEDLHETYGRKVEIVRYQAQGATNDAVAAQADAVAVIEQFHPFASLGGPATPAYAEELTRQGILCFACSATLPDTFTQDHAPYLWGAGMTSEQLGPIVSDFLIERVMGRKASFAGDEELKTRTRVFGILSYEQDPPVFDDVTKRNRECSEQRGFAPAASETYTYDIGKFGERSTTVIAKMKAAGVTTVVFFGDPIMPIYVTRAATEQNYFPEWIVTGTGLTDTTVLSRMYEPQQWKHAFGLSQLPGRSPRETSGSWYLHRWYYGEPPKASNTEAIIFAPLGWLFQGIHLAGPDLNAETFKAGLFNAPQAGGGPTTPHVSYGDHGYFKLWDRGNCRSTEARPDFNGGDDVTEIWWDADATGPDEQGREGQGMWRYANNGTRYLPGEMPTTDTDAFKMENSVTIFETPPPESEPPSYPSPARK